MRAKQHLKLKPFLLKIVSNTIYARFFKVISLPIFRFHMLIGFYSLNLELNRQERKYEG